MSDIVILILQISAAVILSFFAHYVVQRIKRDKYEGVALQEIFKQFKDAREEGEISEEEFGMIRRELSEKIISESNREKQESSRQIKFMPEEEKRLKK